MKSIRDLARCWMEQINIFEYSKPKYKIANRIRLIELFAGIGAQAKALEMLGADFEHYRCIEWDKYAMASYNAVHGTNFETSDICKIHASDLGIVERERFTYIMTYSFPCQDLSLAGKGRGMTKGEGTRSGLLWEVERLLDECDGLPQVLLMENVPQVHGKKNLQDFQKWQSKLSSLGYSNYCQDLNAKDYGIPQNRNRCFMVSILGDWFYEFPKPFPLKLRLKDMLEDKVDEKYYLSDAMLNYFIANNEMQKEKGNGFRFEPIKNSSEAISKAVNTRNGENMQDTFLCDIERERERVSKAIKTAEGTRMTDNFVAISTEEQGNTNPIKYDPQTDCPEPWMRTTTSIRN